MNVFHGLASGCFSLREERSARSVTTNDRWFTAHEFCAALEAAGVTFDRPCMMTEVTIVHRVPPPSQPPPAGGRRRVPAPSGRGSGRGPAPCPRRRGADGTPALPGHVHRGVVRHAHDRLT